MGSGAAYLYTGTQGDESAQIRNSNYNGVNLSTLTDLGYCSYVKQWNGGQAPYVILNVDKDNNGTIDDLLFFEPLYSNGSYNPSIPVQPTPTTNTWQCWNALAGGWYGIDATTGAATFGGPGTGVLPFSDYTSANPNAVLRNSTRGAVRILVGFASPTDVFESYVDAAKIGTTSGCTTYDFEQFSTPSSAEQCKKGGWQTFNPSRPAGPFKNQGDCIQYVNTAK